MDLFPVDWLGRCGPHQITVAVAPEEIRDILLHVLIDESSVSWFVSTFASDRTYTGKFRDDTFTISPCRRGRRPQPTLKAKFNQVEGGTRIEFTIEPDSFAKIFLFGYPILLLGILGDQIGALFSHRSPVVPPCLLPVAITFLLVVRIFNLWQTSNESMKLLQFFLARINIF